jgi:hypothetical protein
MKQCIERDVVWAIFSDEFDIVFPNWEIPWYDKSPDNVTEDEYPELLNNFMAKLSRYDEIWFYHNPGRFHPRLKGLSRMPGTEG